jgi:hypothetical protein
MPGLTQRRGADKKDVLPGNKRLVFITDVIVELCHEKLLLGVDYKFSCPSAV